MASNYSAGIPIGNNGQPQIGSPAPFKAVGRYFVENGAVSSVITLTADTTAVEIANSSANRAVLLRWVATSDTAASVTTANFDHTVPANSFRRLVVPIEGMNNAQGYGSMVGANIANGLFRRVAVISAGPASILTTEYGSSNSY